MTTLRAALLAICVLLAMPAAQAQVLAKAAPAARASNARDAKAYRFDGARHIYAAYPDRVYKGKLPALIHAIVIAEVDVDASGNVRGINMIRSPSHAPEVTASVREMIQKASPLPAPARLGGTKYLDIWLVDKSGRFQLDTLTEGQL
jgi:periplasmic protein TonB